MNREQKRKLGIIVVLGIALLVGGTFAFTAFNQQAINDRLRDNEVEVGGRVHDYYNRDTENKDVFVENYGQTPIMARIRLSEFMEIQERGQTGFTPVVSGTTRADTPNWTTYIPSADNLNIRTGAGAAFNQYSNLTFGWTRSGQTAPWYMPTFNHNDEDLRTAAAGDARDYLEEGATHPGDGTDAYWSEGENHDNSTGTWPGSMVTRETAQNLSQDRAPITLQTWAGLEEEEQIGNFWVIDHETGWAYWANQLNEGQTTSYLLDAAEMTPAADAINGSYYYGIHVDSELISPHEEFQEEATTGDVSALLEEIRNRGDGNPSSDAPVAAFNFSSMNPGRIFTMAGEQYRYLENMGSGNHLIIRNDAIRNRSWSQLDETLSTWYTGLDGAVQAMVQPVANSFTTGMITPEEGGRDAQNWLFTNLDSNPEVAADVTQVTQGANSSPQAFALSLADVNRLSGTGLGFPNLAQRVGANNSWWWLRTPVHETSVWHVHNGSNAGQFFGGTRTGSDIDGGVRPALIINQPTN